MQTVQRNNSELESSIETQSQYNHKDVENLTITNQYTEYYNKFHKCEPEECLNQQ